MSAALALPDVERSSPVTVSRDCPVLYVFKPVTETSFSDGLRYPVYGVVVFDKVIFYRCLLDVP